MPQPARALRRDSSSRPQAPPASCVLIAMAVGGSVPILVVWFKASKPPAAIDDQLPDLLITLAASLKAGHSFRQAIQAVVDEGAAAGERRVQARADGDAARPADRRRARRDGRPASARRTSRSSITAVTIQRQVGGCWPALFDMVAEAVRQRQQFARKIRGLTAMGRCRPTRWSACRSSSRRSITLINADVHGPLYHTSTGHKMSSSGS